MVIGEKIGPRKSEKKNLTQKGQPGGNERHSKEW
jgi:hypothetical protein